MVEATSLDDLLEQELGWRGFGPAQWLALLIGGLAYAVMALMTFSMTFAYADPLAGDSPPTWRCVDPTDTMCTTLLAQELAPHGLQTSPPPARSFCDLSPSQTYWLQPGNSLSSEYNLVCGQRWKASILETLFFAGFLAGNAVFGTVTDRYGRRSTLAACGVATVLLTALSASPVVPPGPGARAAAAAALAATAGAGGTVPMPGSSGLAASGGSMTGGGGGAGGYWVYLGLRSLSGFACAGTALGSYVLATEMVGPSWRGAAGMLTQTFYILGEFLLVALSLAWPRWRHLTAAVAAAAGAGLLLLPLVPESPRWLLANGRNEKARSALLWVARLNGRRPPPSLVCSQAGEIFLLPHDGTIEGAGSVYDTERGRRAGAGPPQDVSTPFSTAALAAAWSNAPASVTPVKSRGSIASLLEEPGGLDLIPGLPAGVGLPAGGGGGDERETAPLLRRRGSAGSSYGRQPDPQLAEIALSEAPGFGAGITPAPTAASAGPGTSPWNGSTPFFSLETSSRLQRSSQKGSPFATASSGAFSAAAGTPSSRAAAAVGGGGGFGVGTGPSGPGSMSRGSSSVWWGGGGGAGGFSGDGASSGPSRRGSGAVAGGSSTSLWLQRTSTTGAGSTIPFDRTSSTAAAAPLARLSSAALNTPTKLVSAFEGDLNPFARSSSPGGLSIPIRRASATGATGGPSALQRKSTSGELRGPRTPVREESFRPLLTDTSPSPSSVTLLTALAHPITRRLLIFSSFTLFALSVSYYGVTLALGSLVSGSLHVNFLLTAAAELPAYLAIAATTDRLGRRAVIGGGTALAGVSCLACAFTRAGPAQVVLAMAGKLGCSGAWAMGLTFTAELFPTCLRSAALSVASLSGDVGGLLSPVLLLLSPPGPLERLPFAVMGGMALAAVALVWQLPETRGMPQLDTFDQLLAWLGRNGNGNSGAAGGEEGGRARRRGRVQAGPMLRQSSSGVESQPVRERAGIEMERRKLVPEDGVGSSSAGV